MAEIHPPLGGIHESALYVDDLRTAERFWRRLGLQLVGKQEGRHVFFRAGRDMLLLFDAEATRGDEGVTGGMAAPDDGALPGDEDAGSDDASASSSGGVPAHGAEGPGHVALDVPDGAALHAWREHLGVAGVEIEHEHEWPSGGRSVYFRDPSGNSIELITRGSWGF